MNKLLHILCYNYNYNAKIIKQFVRLVIQTINYDKSRDEISQFSERMYIYLRLCEILKTDNLDEISFAKYTCTEIRKCYSIDELYSIFY